MTQNYPQFENTLLKTKPNWKEEACRIPIMERVDQEPTASLNEENGLNSCWEPKIWTLIIGILQMIVCTIGLTTVILLGQDKLSEWLMLYFEGVDNRDFFNWIVIFPIVLFSNGILWGFLLYLGAKYESVSLLNISLIAEFFAAIVTGVASILAMRAYILGLEIRFIPPSTVFPISCILFIGHLLGQGRIWLLFLCVQQCESNSSLEQGAASEL